MPAVRYDDHHTGADFRTLVQAAYFQRINLSAQGFYIVPTERCGYDFTIPGDDNTKRGQVSVCAICHVNTKATYIPQISHMYAITPVDLSLLDD